MTILSPDNRKKSTNIDKLDFETIERESIPFTLISTFVIQNIKNHFAGFIWVFLQSLPPTWTANKAHLMKHFEISERTYQRHMSFLSASNLVCYQRIRLENGTLGPVYLKVLNGTEFNVAADSCHTVKIGVVDFNHTAKKPPSGGTTPVVFGTLINTTINITKTTKETNTPISPKGDDVSDKLSQFEIFWERYPSKKAKKTCEAIWKRKKLDSQCDGIMARLKDQVEKDDQWLRGFVPNPSTYLNQERWNDELSAPREDLKRKEEATRKAVNDKRITEQAEQSRKQADYERGKQKNMIAERGKFASLAEMVRKQAEESK